MHEQLASPEEQVKQQFIDFVVERIKAPNYNQQGPGGSAYVIEKSDTSQVFTCIEYLDWGEVYSGSDSASAHRMYTIDICYSLGDFKSTMQFILGSNDFKVCADTANNLQEVPVEPAAFSGLMEWIVALEGEGATHLAWNT